MGDLQPAFDDTLFESNPLVTEANSLLRQAKEASQHIGIFTVKTANEWIDQAKLRPIPKKLFGELWFEGELCILFADTNLGKSILAVQIGDSISKGVPIVGFPLEAKAQSILYFDFELSDKQFENRYSADFSQHYQFNDNFKRIEINPDSDPPESGTFEDCLIESLECAVVETGARVLIIDNLTYLRNETEKAKDALFLMKHLKGLKTKYGLSILVLAHTPKRDFTKPISRNDLSGSKMLMNFCDSAFTIGESHSDKSIRYIKQIKVRNTEAIYDAESVALCQICKPNNFLMFEFVGLGSERDHLKQMSDKDWESLTDRVLELYKLGKSLREIGSELNISHMKVSRILKNCNTM